MEKETLIVNLFGGPGTGKSTLCADLFAKLKWRHTNCEMALEFAKDKVWEESFKVLDNQIYIFGQRPLNLDPGQSYHYERSLWLEKPGNYHLFCVYKTRYGSWVDEIPTDSGISNSLDIYVEVLSIAIHSNYDWQVLSTTNLCRGTGTKKIHIL